MVDNRNTDVLRRIISYCHEIEEVLQPPHNVQR